MGLGRAREEEPEGRRQFLAVELGALSSSVADIPMATGTFLGARTDVLPSVEDGKRPPGRCLWVELLM